MSDNDEAFASKQAALEALIAADTDAVECEQAAIQLLRTKVYELFSQEPIFDLPVLDYVENRLKTTLCGDRPLRRCLSLSCFSNLSLRS